MGEVGLYHAHVTDAGLEQLKKLPRLQYIHLHGTNVTESGIQDLKTRRPRIFVDWLATSSDPRRSSRSP